MPYYELFFDKWEKAGRKDYARYNAYYQASGEFILPKDEWVSVDADKCYSLSFLQQKNTLLTAFNERAVMGDCQVSKEELEKAIRSVPRSLRLV